MWWTRLFDTTASKLWSGSGSMGSRAQRALHPVLHAGLLHRLLRERDHRLRAVHGGDA